MVVRIPMMTMKKKIAWRILRNISYDIGMFDKWLIKKCELLSQTCILIIPFTILEKEKTTSL